MATTASTVSTASEEMAGTSDETGRAVHEIASGLGDVASGSERQMRMVEAARVASGTMDVVEGVEAGARRTQDGVATVEHTRERSSASAPTCRTRTRASAGFAVAVTEISEALVRRFRVTA